MNIVQKLGALGVMMGATSIAGSYVIPEVRGNEDYIRQRAQLEKTYALRHPEYSPRSEQELVRQAYDDRETGRVFANNLGFGLAEFGLIWLIAGLSRKRKPQKSE